MVGVEQWAQIRRMHFVEQRSQREIHRLTGLHRDTIRRAIHSDEPPRYRRMPVPSLLDPVKDWIAAQHAAAPRKRDRFSAVVGRGCIFNRRRRVQFEPALTPGHFDWIEVFYNRVRRHSSIGMQSPISFEKPHQQLTTAA